MLTRNNPKLTLEGARAILGAAEKKARAIKVPMNIAVGSSAFMVGVTASGGFLGHLIAGHFDWRIAFLLAPGIFLGGQIGARQSVKIGKKKMKVYFGYFLVALSAFLLIRTAL